MRRFIETTIDVAIKYGSIAILLALALAMLAFTAIMLTFLFVVPYALYIGDYATAVPAFFGLVVSGIAAYSVSRLTLKFIRAIRRKRSIDALVLKAAR